VYVSTDYVFRGDAGPYAEGDPVMPVNKYAWSKLGGECAVRLYDNALIIRTTFGENAFPYPKAFTDQWTSRLGVAQMAPKIVKAALSSVTGTLHVGGPRRTVYEYAKSLDPAKEIGALSINDINFAVPVDTSLDTGRYDREIG
jgi:dTDP-4-dehydrorhamnose reductase